jgi:hypothetical protein
VTWATLVAILREIELVELASDIAAVKMSWTGYVYVL